MVTFIVALTFLLVRVKLARVSDEFENSSTGIFPGHRNFSAPSSARKANAPSCRTRTGRARVFPEDISALGFP
ncbi:MAG TPA: hypothetical protein VI320_04235 [Terracidiphilus sp.]|jgi:hypothetical protein